MTQFTWIPFYEELADLLAGWRGRQKELIAFLEQQRAKGRVVTPLNDLDASGKRELVTQIDPFTFLGAFNRGTTVENRFALAEDFRSHFGVKAQVPQDFAGIPVLNNQRSWFVSYKKDRGNSDVDALWDIFQAALSPAGLKDPKFAPAFDAALRVKGTNLNLTMGLFWIRPRRYLSLDGTLREFLKLALPPSGLSFKFYASTLEKVEESRGADWPTLSVAAWHGTPSPSAGAPKTFKIDPAINYWLVGAYWAGSDPADQTERMLAEGQWVNGYSDRLLDEVKRIKPGDKIAIKVAGTQKHDLPFEYGGKTASRMTIKATGTVLANRNDGQIVEVDWDPISSPRHWYFYTGRGTVWRLKHDDALAQRLIRFAFGGEQQDYAYFLQTPGAATPVEAGLDTANAATPYSAADVVEDGAFISEAEVERALSLLGRKKNLVLQGAPGVGKTFLARKLAYAWIGAVDPARVIAVQFHPSFTYEDFVRGYRPAGEAGKFVLRDGPFVRACQAAAANPELPHVLLIDEINRAHLSQVFGELFQLLEPDKRGKPNGITPLYCRTDDEWLWVPDNLYVIGTMNIADRSLALVDFALRRRFAFLSLEPQFSSDLFRKHLASHGMKADLIDRIVGKMTELNATIADDTQLGPAFRIGHSFFCVGQDFSASDDAWYRTIIETEIQPLLEEYWYDNKDKVHSATKLLLE